MLNLFFTCHIFVPNFHTSRVTTIFSGFFIIYKSKSSSGYISTYSGACWFCISLFTLPDTDSGTDSDSDSKLDGYIVLYRTCSHCTDLNSDAYPDSDSQSPLHPNFRGISLRRLGSGSISGNVINHRKKYMLNPRTQLNLSFFSYLFFAE